MNRDIARMVLLASVPMLVSLILSWIIPSWLVPYLWFVSVVAAIIIAVIEWILEYHGHEYGSNLAWQLYDGHPVTGWPVEQVRKLSGRQVPRPANRIAATGEVVSDWPRELQVRDKQALAALGARVKDRIFGHDAALDGMISDLGFIVTVNRPRDNRPWLRFILVGDEALGKGSLAILLGQGLCSNQIFAFRATITADGFDIGKLLAHVKAKPCSIILFDGIEKANNDTVQLIGDILDGRALADEHGHNVSFRDCQVFLLSHRTISVQDVQVLTAGYTVTIDSFAQICNLKTDFIYKTQGQFLFRFPQLPDQLSDLIDIVEAAFRKTARVMNFPIENVIIPPTVVSNEIEKVRKLGNYSQLEPRIENYLSRNREQLLASTLQR